MKLELLCESCGSPFWLDMEVVAINNSIDLNCPYCLADTKISKEDLETCKKIMQRVGNIKY